MQQHHTLRAPRRSILSAKVSWIRLAAKSQIDPSAQIVQIVSNRRSSMDSFSLVLAFINSWFQGSSHGSLFMLTWWWSPLQLGRQEYTNVFENAYQRLTFPEFSSSCPQNRRNEECPTKWQHSRGRSLRPRKCSAPSFPPCRPPQPPSADRPSA